MDPRVWYSRHSDPRVAGRTALQIDFIKHWLPPDIVAAVYLRHINEMMAIRAKNMGTARREHRSAVSVLDFYCFLCRYLLVLLADKGRLKDHRRKVDDLMKALMGHNRYEEIYACCEWTDKTIEIFHEDFNSRAPLLLILGAVITVDETLLAYFGLDGKLDEILRYYPHKPHDYGVLGWRAVAKFVLTRTRVTVGMLPTLPHLKYTPTAAANTLIKRLRTLQRGSSHLLLDSAFATEELLTELRRMDVAFTISIKANRSAGYAPVYEMATAQLEPGHVRTYAVDGLIIQARRQTTATKEGSLPYHIVLSNGWRLPPNQLEPIKRTLTYKSIKTLYLQEDDATLARLFNVPNSGSKRDIILAGTNWDVLAPEPDSSGRIVWAEESLTKMGAELLRDLHRLTPSCARSSSKNISQLVADILAHHPAVQLSHAHAPQQSARAADIVALRQFVGNHTTMHGPVLDFYSQEYGAVDEVNQEIYRSILLRYHRSWHRLAGFSVLHSLVMNAWSNYIEATAYSATHNHLGERLDVALPSQQPFDEFIWQACKQLVSEKKR